MEEKRITLRLLTYWQSLAKNTPYPDIKRFNPTAVEEIWGHCCRLSIIPSTIPSYKYEYVGNIIIDLFGRDLTGQIVDSRMASFPGAVLYHKLDEVVKTSVAVQDEGHMPNLSGQLIKYRACMLPFGNKKGLTHIIIGLNYRYF